MRVEIRHFSGESRLPVRRDEIAIAIDVMRATTTIACALANGARAVVPVEDADRATALAAGIPGALLAGERDNQKIPGFHLGNSPREYDGRVSGNDVILVTTNGTRLLAALRDAPVVWCASFANLSSVALALSRSNADAVTLHCAGQKSEFSLEDFTCAGGIVASLESMRAIDGDDASIAARSLYERATNLSELLRLGNHARSLAATGFAQDVEFCAVVDRHAILPASNEGRIVADSAID